MTNEMLTKARQSVLGSILISPQIVVDVVQQLTQEDFGPGAGFLSTYPVRGTTAKCDKSNNLFCILA